MTQNWQLEYLITNSNNNKLLTALQLFAPHSTVGSLAMNDNFEVAELGQFLTIYRLEGDATNTGAEDFPSEMMKSKKLQKTLPDDIYDSLIDYYRILNRNVQNLKI
ncbi:12265_t:CDS:2 [Dentiscutata erythropus]|uniref:12265_t:CDS:1 n=1 Tax=Dentiscutata erythropus TaxID=1348616 RepID=A0A9N9F6B3_9GLOM|nr:12265_t:CDS:2 [Dentiscutata erythropus]